MFADRGAGFHVKEALCAFGVLGLFIFRKSAHEFICDIDAVYHDAFGCSGVDASAADHNAGFGGVEGLILVPSEMVAVERVGGL